MWQLRGENQRAETRLVDEDRLTFVVRTSVANCDGGFVFFIYVFSQSWPSADGPWRFLDFLGAFHRSLIRENQSCYEDLTNSIKMQLADKQPFSAKNLTI